MNVTASPPVDRLSAPSDFDEKLPISTSWPRLAAPGVPSGTAMESTRAPPGVSWSRYIGAVTPKLASTETLSQTCA